MSMESAINLNLMDIKQKMDEPNELLRSIKALLEENNNKEEKKKIESTGTHCGQ